MRQSGQGHDTGPYEDKKRNNHGNAHDICAAEAKKLGIQLRALREAQGLSYEDVASATHVRPHVIQSIENGSIEESVAQVYAKGFVKTYCEYLMASDLWRKYSLGIPSDEPGELDAGEAGEQVEIKHTTPIFRRSSIIWVYMVLVMAVLGAAYLLWNQSRQEGGTENPFPFNMRGVSADVPPVSSSDASPAPAASENIILMPISGDAVISIDVRSSDILSIPEPLSADVVSPDRAGVPSGDLSWMNEPLNSAMPAAVFPQFEDRTLMIEITGSSNRLTVEQSSGGSKWKLLTRRTLGIGGRRSYDVAADTKVTVSAGNMARVTWFGKSYDSVGSDNRAVTLIFHPDGSVTLVRGQSPHFARAGDNG
jgi:transcriptional regulator with XRE-family HTH domain